MFNLGGNECELMLSKSSDKPAKVSRKGAKPAKNAKPEFVSAKFPLRLGVLCVKPYLTFPPITTLSTKSLPKEYGRYANEGIGLVMKTFARLPTSMLPRIASTPMA